MLLLPPTGTWWYYTVKTQHVLHKVSKQIHLYSHEKDIVDWQHETNKMTVGCSCSGSPSSSDYSATVWDYTPCTRLTLGIMPPLFVTWVSFPAAQCENNHSQHKTRHAGRRSDYLQTGLYWKREGVRVTKTHTANSILPGWETCKDKQTQATHATW